MHNIFKKIVRSVCIVLLLLNAMSVYADEQNDTGTIECECNYSITKPDDTITFTANFIVTNGKTTTENPVLIVSLYEYGKMIDMESVQPTINSNGVANETVSVVIPTEKADNCYIKIFAWEAINSLKPIGEVIVVNDVNYYISNKSLYITANENSEFNVYMNMSTVNGATPTDIHTIEYDSTKMQPIDLCGFTYKKELIAGTVVNTNVVIESVDKTKGKIKYRFLNSSGTKTGINNVVKFKALTTISNCEIKYKVQ